MAVNVKREQDLAFMREGGQILARTFEELARHIRVGVSAQHLDKVAHDTITRLGAKPSFLGYRGYKYSTCISKNEEIVHGIPYADKCLFPGDICGIDVGVYYKGFHTDAARTFAIEPLDKEIDRLLKVTEASFFEGIKQAVPGKRLGDLSHAIQSYVESNGFTVVRDLYSHGVGRQLHEDPLIPNYGKAGSGIKLQPGMTFAIEPMVNVGVADILTLDDNWTIITADRKWSCHYENTIALTENGNEVLTILRG